MAEDRREKRLSKLSVLILYRDSGNSYRIACLNIISEIVGPVRFNNIGHCEGKWDGPDVALTCIYDKDGSQGQTYHFSVKSEDFRYTLYSNDAEELYDHRNDPHEWKNLAKDQGYRQVKSEMKRKLFELLGDNPDEERGSGR